MRIYLQDKTGAVIEPASLQEVRLPECKLLWVNLEKPSSEELALMGRFFDIHLNTVSNRLNVTMKRLTTIATIFTPLTFLVGLYGMNFRHMPELGWRYGYLMAWIVLLVITIAMIIIARVKDWF